jgi:hypothetical protein
MIRYLVLAGLLSVSCKMQSSANVGSEAKTTVVKVPGVADLGLLEVATPNKLFWESQKDKKVDEYELTMIPTTPESNGFKCPTIKRDRHFIAAKFFQIYIKGCEYKLRLDAVQYDGRGGSIPQFFMEKPVKLTDLETLLADYSFTALDNSRTLPFKDASTGRKPVEIWEGTMKPQSNDMPMSGNGDTAYKFVRKGQQEAQWLQISGSAPQGGCLETEFIYRDKEESLRVMAERQQPLRVLVKPTTCPMFDSEESTSTEGVYLYAFMIEQLAK